MLVTTKSRNKTNRLTTKMLIYEIQGTQLMKDYYFSEFPVEIMSLIDHHPSLHYPDRAA